MNKCHFIGNLTRDPVLKKTTNSCVVRFGLAVSRPFKRGTERVKETVFLDCEAWDKGAELIEKHFKKGSPIIVSDGSLKTDEWTDKNTGEKRSKLIVRVNEFEFPPFNERKAEPSEKVNRESEYVPAGAGEDEPVPF